MVGQDVGEGIQWDGMIWEMLPPLCLNERGEGEVGGTQRGYS